MIRTRLILIVLLSMTAVVCFAYQKGDVLSYVEFGEPPYGLDVRELSLGTELHAMTDSGQAYQMGIEAASAVKNGKEAVSNSKNPLMADPQTYTGFRGLALMKTYQGSYGWRYIACSSNRTNYRATWDYPDPLGDMSWIRITNAWQLLSSGDIAPTARAKVEGSWPVLWTVFSGTVDDVYQDTVYKYPDAPWTTRYDYTESFSMPKPLKGISLGDNGQLWVLCQDGEILCISDSDGSIIERFYISPTIASPFGIAYDASEPCLWISSPSSSMIYQVAVEAAEYSNADINDDTFIDILDFRILASQWLQCSDPFNSSCDQFYN